ncbi:unnamed protein product [Echinostoma caproni]|uniref:COesterase domain-containing protein n=1 Tax=Echinostoma caproni TaxID=27848 RepID=A0A183AFQ8_9TREM|nr:unnamed protein product [Echinostoma caproni]
MYLSRLIKAEVNRLNDRILRIGNSKQLWQGIKLLYVRKKVRPKLYVNVDDPNAAFQHKPSGILPAYSTHDVCNVEPFSYCDVLKLLTSCNPSSAEGLDELPSAFFKFGADSPAGKITTIVNESHNTSTIPPLLEAGHNQFPNLLFSPNVFDP